MSDLITNSVMAIRSRVTEDQFRSIMEDLDELSNMEFGCGYGRMERAFDPDDKRYYITKWPILIEAFARTDSASCRSGIWFTNDPGRDRASFDEHYVKVPPERFVSAVLTRDALRQD